MPLITGNRAIGKAYIGATELSAIMHAGVNLLDGTVLPRKGRTFLMSKSSLILDEGAGGPTWSRATKAWGFNELGYLEELASGCAFFGGARLVRNLLAGSSQDLSSASWSKTGSPTITYTSGVSTVTTPGVATECKISQYPSFANSSPTNVGKVASAYWKIRGTNGQTIKLGVQEGAPAYESNEFTHTFNGDWQLVYSQKTLVSVTGTQAGIYFRKSVSDAAITFDLAECQLEDITGYDSSYVPEYVSVGVLSAPFHGAGIDGAKYFETDWQGAPIPAANLLKVRRESAATNNLLRSRDLSNAAWSTKTNITAAKTATGLDGIANTATTLTATAADAIILQPITLASAARCASSYVKRRTGTGTISFTQDGGSTWTDITSQINSSTWSRVEITATLANPSVGFKLGTSGDAIDVDCAQNEAGSVATSPIVTTTAAVTRNAESLTYQTASNWSDTAGTAYIEAQPLSWVAGGAIGSATNGLLLSAANSGATASDGTNTANGPAGTPSGRKKLALRWGGGAMTVASGGVVGTPGTYDGAMGLASIGIAVNSSTYCGPVAIYDYAMTDAELQAITT